MRAKLLLAGAAILLSSVVVEVGARLLPAPGAGVNFTTVPRAIKVPSHMPGVPYLLRPDFEVEHVFHTDPDGYFGPSASLRYRTNSQGFRGPEFSTLKPEGVFRIVLLGDSFTFGTGVREEDTFAAVLRRQLGEQFEVLNLGMMGIDTVHEVNLLRQHGLRFRPDLVVICMFLNDAGGGGPQPFKAAAASWEQPLWRRWLRSVDRVMVFFERRRALRKLVDSYERSFGPSRERWRETRKALSETRGLGPAFGFELAVVLFPVLWELSGDYPFAESHRRIAHFAGELGVPFLDLRPSFAGNDGPELWAHPSNQHPNRRAHAIAGAAIHAFLEREALIAAEP